ncbi:hypothetical protein [Oceanobacillus profundus]|uniref:Uncharacterized protein n=1 Tax=Oceanobacillus profundus TaxID=372463 RepID=A0A417YNH4_9BACI|nr:hypothetical protein [Oceanobacillus profundus]MCM3398717.1 hypothetical protein [Oceanobacillus profundus]MDO6450210.1 hypothetical protein [Oceanobacillus profundus]PAE30619.1 hypothetical protein CHI07_02765 [Paenibacillus sp. 7884-2]RHW35325.1 hypothetical protein D1B32_01520 [Oceanobacillus profundus]
MSKNSIERGQSITFRVPSDTPDYLLKQLQHLKEKERRNFSSTIAGFVLEGVGETFKRERETITIPLPKQLTKEQRSWLKHEHSEALIGSLLHQLLSDPLRATTLLAGLNHNAANLDEASFVQEAPPEKPKRSIEAEIDLDDLNLDGLDIHEEVIPEEKEDEDPLGDFFASMNK